MCSVGGGEPRVSCTYPAGAVEVLGDDKPLLGPVPIGNVQLLDDGVAVVDLKWCVLIRRLKLEGELRERVRPGSRLEVRRDVGLDAERLPVYRVGRRPHGPGLLRHQGRVRLVRAEEVRWNIGPRLGGRVGGARIVVADDARSLIACLSYRATEVGSICPDPEVAVLGHWVGPVVGVIRPGLYDDPVALPDPDKNRRGEVRLDRDKVHVDDLENVIVDAEAVCIPEGSVDQTQQVPLSSSILADLSFFKLQGERLWNGGVGGRV